MISKDSHYEIQCWRCHTSYVLPRALYVAAKNSEKIIFYCPYGHEAHFAAGETEEDKLRRERDLLKQQMAERDDKIHRLIKVANDADAMVRKVKAEKAKLTKRVSAGVCVCCNRTFSNMQRHMRTKHPEFKAEAA
ncbi:hypothetical protein EHM76_04300 [bacterium]|nr:MAG: hypothetical protein EHM76_04300 [bacterium]